MEEMYMLFSCCWGCASVQSVLLETRVQALTNRGEYLHGPHGGLDVKPELLQGQQALALEVLQLSNQDQVLLHQGPHRRRQRVVHLAVLKGRLLLDEAERQIKNIH